MRKFLLMMLPAFAIFMVSCNGDDDDTPGASGPPEVTAVSPGEAVPGDEITLTGSNLASVTRVSLGVNQVDYNASESSITFTVPEGTEPNNYDITVVNPSGNTTAQLTVIRQAGPPEINAISYLQVAPGDEVTVVGVNLIDIEAVSIGGTAAESYESFAEGDSMRVTVPEGAADGTMVLQTAHGEVETEMEFTIYARTLLISDFDGFGIRPTWNSAGAMQDPEIRDGQSPQSLYGNYMHFETVPVDEVANGFALVQPDAPEEGPAPYGFNNTDPGTISVSFYANSPSEFEYQIIITTNDPNRDIYAAYRDIGTGWNHILINLNEFGLGYGADEIVDEADRLNPANIIAVDFRFIPNNFNEAVQIGNVDNVMFVEE